jgi:hypothetical protein
MRVTLFFVMLVTCIISAKAQSKPSTVDTTYGNCSPNMAHNSGSVTIVCKGLDPAVASEMSEVVKDLSALNRKTATEKNQQLMIKMLRDMRASLEHAVSGETTTIIQNSTGNCSPNIVGNNNVNNCVPPVRVFTSFDVPQPRPSEDGHPRVALRFFTDNPWAQGSFAIFCDRSCHINHPCLIPGINPPSEWGHVVGRSDIATMELHTAFPASTDCDLTVESDDQEAIHVIGVMAVPIFHKPS